MDRQSVDSQGNSDVVLRWAQPLLVAAIPWGFAVYQFLQFRILAAKNRMLIETTGSELSRTQVGSPLAWSFVLAVIGLIVLIVASQKSNVTNERNSE